MHDAVLGNLKRLLQLGWQGMDCQIAVATNPGFADDPATDAVDLPQHADGPGQCGDRLREASGIEQQRCLARQPGSSQGPDFPLDKAALQWMDLLVQRNAAELNNAEHQPPGVDAVGNGPAQQGLDMGPGIAEPPGPPIGRSHSRGL
jgi:hypothetical protein